MFFILIFIWLITSFCIPLSAACKIKVGYTAVMAEWVSCSAARCAAILLLKHIMIETRHTSQKSGA
jgi:hypothetical protein